MLSKEIAPTSHNACCAVVDESPKPVSKSPVCGCHNSKITTIRVDSNGLSSSIRVCSTHGLVEENFGGASTGIADAFRRCVTHSVFLEMCSEWMKQFDSVLEGQLFFLENEIFANGNLAAVRERFAEIRKLHDWAHDDLIRNERQDVANNISSSAGKQLDR